MTSMTMYDQSWTAPTMLSMWTEPATKRSKVVRQASKWVGAIDTTVTVLCPPVVSACAIFAAVVWPAHDPSDMVGHSAISAPINAQVQQSAPAP
ncbi:hypothetical protein H7J51_12100 [Mycobacterium crocinum]|uniref:Uncharacterized protein n=1 Tax=Mycolicibacterium crocinum TaxID=388459 RepID=A0ABY3TIG0_9MYCO|nr:hypothetical protein [Mycolicibacterium crocinum]MCV7216022.1 hypothetical protein [Mycolicibacterium crocinum]ULN40963.1 hypothetical protein MI149_25645 [Mycolicibacterium crocinum]